MSEVIAFPELIIETPEPGDLEFIGAAAIGCFGQQGLCVMEETVEPPGDGVNIGIIVFGHTA